MKKSKQATQVALICALRALQSNLGNFKLLLGLQRSASSKLCQQRLLKFQKLKRWWNKISCSCVVLYSSSPFQWLAKAKEVTRKLYAWLHYLGKSIIKKILLDQAKRFIYSFLLRCLTRCLWEGMQCKMTDSPETGTLAHALSKYGGSMKAS